MYSLLHFSYNKFDILLNMKGLKNQQIYRIQFKVAVYAQQKNIYSKEVVIPSIYEKRSQCRKHIQKEIKARIKHAMFFVSPRIDYDLVRYTREASYNTYIRYRIIPEMVSHSKSTQTLDDGLDLYIDSLKTSHATNKKLSSNLNAKRMLYLQRKIFKNQDLSS